MKLPGGFGPSEADEERAAVRKSMSLLDWLTAASFLIFAASFMSVVIVQFYTVMHGSNTPNVVAGFTYRIVELGWHTTGRVRYVTPVFGKFYDALSLPGEIAGAVMLILFGIQWLTKRKNPAASK